MDTIELSSKLIKFKSITPDNTRSIDYIQKILKKTSLAVICSSLELVK